MPPYTDTSPEAIAERHRESVVAQNRLRELTSRSPQILEHIQAAVRTFNGTPGEPARSIAARAARGAGLSAVVLADRVARDQLPPVLRHQQSRRAARGGHRRLRRDPSAARAAHPRRARHRRADRSSGRPVRSGALFRDAAGPGGRRVGHSARPPPTVRSTSSPKRSCRGASSCRPAGRSTARPATTSSTR